MYIPNDTIYGWIFINKESLFVVSNPTILQTSSMTIQYSFNIIFPNRLLNEVNQKIIEFCKSCQVKEIERQTIFSTKAVGLHQSVSLGASDLKNVRQFIECFSPHLIRLKYIGKHLDTMIKLVFIDDEHNTMPWNEYKNQLLPLTTPQELQELNKIWEWDAL